MDLGPKAEMREIRTSGLMSGIWKRDRLGHRARSRLYRAKALAKFPGSGAAQEAARKKWDLNPGRTE